MHDWLVIKAEVDSIERMEWNTFFENCGARFLNDWKCQIIDEKERTPYLNGTTMAKYFTYDSDNWCGYGDEETHALKECFADNRCLYGIII